MTLILEIDINMVKMYYHTKNEVSVSTASKVIAGAQTDTHRHAHRHYEDITSAAYAGGKYK